MGRLPDAGPVSLGQRVSGLLHEPLNLLLEPVGRHQSVFTRDTDLLSLVLKLVGVQRRVYLGVR